jgi:enoyl-CoA hydratase/carnithine racemase
MAQCKHVKIERTEHVVSISWNRPEKKNALTQAMYASAAQALNEASTDQTVRAVVLSGTDDCFTAGNDLADFLDNPPTGDDAPVFQFLRAIATFEKPLIAAVNGVAIGVGTTMLLHCDLVVAADSSIFSLPFVKLGLCPEASSSYLLPLLGGHQRAAELLMLGEQFNAQTAKECGIVNRVSAASDYKDLALSLAGQLAKLPPASIRATKTLLKQNHQENINARMKQEADIFGQMLAQPEAIEAMSAFMERRPADFSQFS